jgi:hypothetical protein
MNTVKTHLTKIKNHVKDHKGTYAMGAVAVAAIALQQWNRTAFTEFMISKGIDPDEYYCPEYYEEKQLTN